MMSERTAQAKEPVIVICGGGNIPFAVADGIIRSGRRVVLYALKGWADPQKVALYPHAWAYLGQFGNFLRVARREGCRDVIFMGNIVRPAITDLRLDWTTLKLLPRIARQFFGGDDHLLSGIARIFEDHGLRVIAAQDVAPDILMPEGSLANRQPSESDRADIAHGLAILKTIAPFDIGQGVVVAGKYVLAVEAAGGTDQMLAHIAELRAKGRIRSKAGVGVLVKAPKSHQDRRLDLPTIGPQTVAAAASAGLAGIAVVAGGTIVAEPDRIATIANGAKIFVAGVRDDAVAS